MYLNRIQTLTKTLQQENIDNILVSDPASIRYLLGYETEPGERLLLLAVASNGKLSLYLNKLFPFYDIPVQLTDSIEVLAYSDGEPVIQTIAERLIEGNVGIDKLWPSHFLLDLMALQPHRQYQKGSYVVDDMRAIKSEQEQAIMKEASRLNDFAMEKIINQLHQGLNEKEMVQELSNIYVELECDGFSFEPIIAYGPNGADPHHLTSSDVPTIGQTVVIDIGSRWNGYCSDMTRTAFYGQPDELSLELYQIVRQANEAAIATVKPGVLFSEVDKAARQVIEKAGYGDYFTHRTGHFIGLEVHEAGDVSAHNHASLKVGQIFSIEPGLYLPGHLGIRIEDLVLVTEEGCDVLNHFTKDPLIIKPVRQ